MKDPIAWQNLHELARRYFDPTDAARAVNLATSRSRHPGALAHLLRHHREERVSDPTELRRRAAFDRLLGYYSLLEVGCIAGALPEELSPDLRKEAATVLERGDVRSCYEEKYPLLLPQLFRQRLKGTNRVRESDTTLSVPLFLQFLEVSDFIEDEDAETFLWFLEDGSIGRYQLTDTLRVLRNARTFLNAVLKPPSRRNTLERSVHGFRKFLSFSTELDALLRRAEKCPWLQSAMWHYHAYWLDHANIDFAGSLKKWIVPFSEWPSLERAKLKQRQRARQNIDEALAVMDRLPRRPTAPAWNARWKRLRAAGAGRAARANPASNEVTKNTTQPPAATNCVTKPPSRTPSRVRGFNHPRSGD